MKYAVALFLRDTENATCKERLQVQIVDAACVDSALGKVIHDTTRTDRTFPLVYHCVKEVDELDIPAFLRVEQWRDTYKDPPPEGVDVLFCTDKGERVIGYANVGGLVIRGLESLNLGAVCNIFLWSPLLPAPELKK